MEGYLLLCHNPTNLISKGIRGVTGSKYNHGAILFEGNVYEFNEYGKVVTPYHGWTYPGTVTIVLVTITNDPRNINGHYDFGIFINETLFYLTDLEFFTNRDNPNAWFCFEFCAEVMGLPNSWKANGKTFEGLVLA